MLCEKCKKNPATVHMQQFVHGVKKEMHLCQECSFKMEMPISLENIFQGFLDQMKHMGHPYDKVQYKPQNLTCTRCGMVFNEFKTNGKLGCDSCYQAFHKPVEALIKNVQGSTRHGGKFPQRSGVILLQKRQVEELRVGLKAAIELENFEEAARIRDEIKELEGANK